MSKSINIPTIYTPSSVNELVSMIRANPKAYLFAGGTYIMSEKKEYPEFDDKDIIQLEKVAELTKTGHSDKYTEFGASLTLQKIMNAGAQIFSPDTINALEMISNSQIRNLSTVGGALCTYEKRFFLPCILSTINAQAEMKTILKNKVVTKIVSIPSLYNEDGLFLYPGVSFMTKIRIPNNPDGKQYFRVSGSPIREPRTTVYFGLNYSVIQSNLEHCHLCISCTENCFFTNNDFDNTLSSLTLPIKKQQMSQVLKLLRDRLSETCRKMSDFQKERAVRFLHCVLADISERFISGELYNDEHENYRR